MAFLTCSFLGASTTIFFAHIDFSGSTGIGLGFLVINIDLQLSSRFLTLQIFLAPEAVITISDAVITDVQPGLSFLNNSRSSPASKK